MDPVSDSLIAFDAAFIALLLAFGASLLLKYLIAHPLRLVSIFGAHPFEGLADKVEELAAYPAAWGQAGMNALTAWPRRILAFDRGLWTYTQAVAGNLFTYSQQIVQVLIPRALAALRAEVETLIREAEDRARGLLVSTVNVIYDDLHRTVGVIQGWVTSAADKAASELASAVTGLASEIDSTASNLTAKLEADFDGLASLIGSTRAQFQSEIQSVAGTLEGDIASGRTAAEGELSGAVQTLEGLIADTNLRTLATAAAETAVVATALEDYLSHCGRDLCGGLGDMSRILPTIMAFLSEGALVAILAAAVESPGATAEAVLAGGGGLVGGVRDDLSALLGLRR